MENLIIGFEAKRAVRNNTGLGNYSRLVVDVLSHEYPNNTYRLYSPDARPNDRLSPLLERKNVSLHTPENSIGKISPGLWRVYRGLTSQLKRDSINLFHGLSNELPLDIRRVGIPSVVTIHDLIFRRLPGCYKPADRMIYDYKFLHACKNATRIIAISQRTRNDIVELYDINPEKIDIVYQGCDSIFSQPMTDEFLADVRRIHGLPGKYIVTVGTVERRKNQLLAVRSLRMLPEDISLVIVGGHNRQYFSEISDTVRMLGLTSRVKILSGVPFAHLPALYAMAEFASYTSRYEGFGIPVIEAIASGTPVIGATGSCLEEAGGPGVIYVNPDSDEEFVEAAGKILDSETLREKLVADGREYIRKFSSVEFSKGLVDVYRKAISCV